MFFHEFTYEIKRILRQKDELFWVLAFPMILGIMFHVAFANINNTTETFHTIPVAVCIENNSTGGTFEQVLDTISSNEEDSFLEITYTNWDNAVKLLEDNTVRGIFRVDEDVSLICAPSDANVNSTLPIEQSILEAFLQEYRTNVAAVTEIVSKNPAKLNDILTIMESEGNYGKELKLTSGNMDNMVQYFYNLIAMACLYTSFAGAQIAVKNQANLSALGARKCVSPNGKFVSMAAQVIACILTQFFCVAVNVLFLVYILQVDFGTSLPMLLLTAFIGCIVGVSFGFFVGCIGHMGESAKMGLMISVSMICCFLSGLMVNNMRAIVESVCPLLNDINPAALISDCFFTLNIYGTGNRYTTDILSLIVISGIFMTIGCLMTRRKTYASL